MRILSKILTSLQINPFVEISGLRATVEADYNSKIFYVYGEPGQNSWGIAFVMKDGYVAERPTSIGLSTGNKDGYTYWVSTGNRPATTDYYFNVTKENTVIDTYRVVCVV